MSSSGQDALAVPQAAPLAASQLYREADLTALPFATTAELAPLLP